MAGWEDQWRRVLRCYERFTALNNGIEHDRNSEFYLDDVYSFFQNCYQLKDWLKNDPDSAVLANDVESHIRADQWLGLCGDLANGTKHLKLTTAKHSPDTKFGPKHFRLGLQAGGPEPVSTTIAVNMAVEAKGVTHDAYIIATEGVAAWRVYLTGKGLL